MNTTIRRIAAPTMLCLAAVAWGSGCGPKAEEPDVVIAPPRNKIEIENTVQVPVANKAANAVVVKPSVKQQTTIVDKKTTVVAPPAKPSLPAPAPARTVAKTNSKASSAPVPPPGPRMGGSAPKTAGAPAPFTKITPQATPGQLSKTDTAAESAPLVVKGQIVAVSKIPDIKNAPYQEALLYVKYRVLSVEKGDYKEKELVAALWGMQKKKLTSAARYKAGETQRLELVPLSDRPDLERIMNWNTLNDFEKVPYFVVKVA